MLILSGFNLASILLDLIKLAFILVKLSLDVIFMVNLG